MNQTTLIEALKPLGFVFNDSGYRDEGYNVDITHPDYPNWKMFCWELKYCDNALGVIKSLEEKKDSQVRSPLSDLWH